jgi:CheY-like chemotaxis protein
MALKILTIDDEPAMTKLTSLLLESYGMVVVSTNFGKEGIQLVRTETPDLILLDLMMPDMTGIEVCQTIRSFSNVPILAYSALNDSQEIVEAIKAGINDHLEKPSPSEILVEHINQLIKA